MATGVVHAADLPGLLRLGNGAVQLVSRTNDSEIFVGSARLIAANLPAANGVVHVLDSVLLGDMSVNVSAIGLAERLGDFGPFNDSQVCCPVSIWNSKQQRERICRVVARVLA